MPYLGSKAFRDWIYRQRETDDAAASKAEIALFRPSIAEIVEAVAKQFQVSEESVVKGGRGQVSANVPRWVALHLSQEIGGKKLTDIAEAFGLKRTYMDTPIISS